MRKIFILGGSNLQLDLILEAKKMFFYVIVLDINKDCIGSKWCDEFLHINIADKEEVLQKAKEYKIDSILTSATELGNITACYVGEKLGLNTNSYECSINTTNKIKMKEILEKNGIKSADYKSFEENQNIEWKKFPCIVKPIDSSGGRGVFYCETYDKLLESSIKSRSFSHSKRILVEEYISGEQFSCETISVNGKHQLIAITKEFIREIPYVVETHHQIPANIDKILYKNIENAVFNLLEKFDFKYGASHIEIRVDANNDIYVVELASRIGGWRTEMLNLAYGVSFSQLLLFSSLKIYRQINVVKPIGTATAKIVLSHDDFLEYLELKEKYPNKIFENKKIVEIEKDFFANNLLEAKGYYYILEKAYEE